MKLTSPMIIIWATCTQLCFKLMVSGSLRTLEAQTEPGSDCQRKGLKVQNGYSKTKPSSSLALTWPTNAEEILEIEKQKRKEKKVKNAYFASKQTEMPLFYHASITCAAMIAWPPWS